MQKSGSSAWWDWKQLPALSGMCGTRYLVQNLGKAQKNHLASQGLLGVGDPGCCIRVWLSGTPALPWHRREVGAPHLLPAHPLLLGPSLSMGWPLGLNCLS